MKLLRLTAWVCAVLWVSVVQAEVNLLPLPQKVVEKQGVFDMRCKVSIFGDDSDGAKPAARLLRSYCKETLHKHLAAPHYLPSKGHCIAFFGDSRIPSEGYKIRMYTDLIEVRASSEAGFFYAVQTLKQLMTSKKVPLVDIDDYPSMAWRGLHFDDCRHFFGKEVLKEFIDKMAAYKFNRLHWHLTDDQGWRLEVKGYPELLEVGAVRPSSPVRGNREVQDGQPYGPYYYTQDDVREVVAYAKERFVTVVPEIEMPGHGYAAIAAYPSLACRPDSLPYRHPRLTWGIEEDVFCLGNDSVVAFLERVLDQVVDLFDSEVVHIGGDEAPTVRWQHCARCQQKMAQAGWTDARQLQYGLVNHMAQYLQGKGRRLMGWSEIYNASLPEGAMLMSWQDLQLGAQAATTGHDVVMCPYAYCYLDYNPQVPGDTLEYFANTLTLEQVYSLDPYAHVTTPDAREHVIGIQGNNWSEYTWTGTELMRKVYPRALALAEIAWRCPEQRDFADFERRVQTRTAVHRKK